MVNFFSDCVLLMHRIKEAHSRRLSVCHEGGMQKNGRRSVSGVVNLPLEAGRLMIRLAVRRDCTMCVFSMQVLTMKKNLIISRSTLLISSSVKYVRMLARSMNLPHQVLNISGQIRLERWQRTTIRREPTT